MDLRDLASDVTVTSTSSTPEQLAAFLNGTKSGEMISRAEATEPDATSAGALDAPVEPIAPDAEEVVESTASPSTTSPKKKSFQARIDEKTAEASAAKQRADAAEQRAAQLERDLAEARRVSARPVDSPVSPAVAAEPVVAKPVVDVAEPKVADFDDYDQFVAARADWSADKKIREAAEKVAAQTQADRARVDTEAAARVHADRLTQYEARCVDARKVHADFDAIKNQPDLPVSPLMADVLLEHELGAEITYALGKSPEDCRRIAALPPAKQLLEMGKFVARVEAASAGPAAITVPRQTPTHKPTKPVSAASSPVVSLEGDAVRGVDPAVFITQRNAQVARRR